MAIEPANDEYTHAPQIFFLMETDGRHRGDGFRILHECVPDETGAVVLRHQHHNTQINSDHVRVIPAGEWVERVHEAVPLPRFWKPILNIAQYLDPIGGEKRN